jgi:hypothetical protein
VADKWANSNNHNLTFAAACSSSFPLSGVLEMKWRHHKKRQEADRSALFFFPESQLARTA